MTEEGLRIKVLQGKAYNFQSKAWAYLLEVNNLAYLLEVNKKSKLLFGEILANSSFDHSTCYYFSHNLSYVIQRKALTASIDRFL